MTGLEKTVCAALLASLVVHPAAATRPPPPPDEFGAHGPLAVCHGELSIGVRSGEALHVVGPIFRIISDDYLVAATPLLLPTMALGAAAGPEPRDMFALDGPTLAFRYSGALPEDIGRYLPYAREGFDAGAIRYAIQSQSDATPTGPVPMLLVASPAFDGSDADKAILRRFAADRVAPADCIRPLDRAAGAVGAAGTAVAGLVNRFDDPLFPGRYPPHPDAGPGYICRDGIGFALRAGEQIRRPWKSQAAGESYYMADGVTVSIIGSGTPMARVDRADGAEHPAGLLHQTNLVFYPSRGVGPPYVPPGVREEGSWLVELGTAQGSRFQIRFPAGDKARVGFGLVERLEFVAADDPRCDVRR